MVKLTEEEARTWEEMHPPELVRRASNIVHWLFGVIFGIIAVFALLQASGILAEGLLIYVWPGLLLLSGAILIIFIFFHHGIRMLKLAVKATWVDPQQKQHSIMGLVIALAGAVELLRTAGALTQSMWGMVMPVVFIIVGIMFMVHTQHGTGEAVRKAVRYHRILGLSIVITGLLRGLQIAISAPAYLWAVALLIVALLLVAYREPEGAYEKPHMAHGMAH